MRIQVGRVHHDRLVIQSAGRQTIHHPGKDPHAASTFPAIVECLMRATLLQSLTTDLPTQINQS